LTDLVCEPTDLVCQGIDRLTVNQHANISLEEVEMQSWVNLVESNIGSSELNADAINFGAMLDEQANTKAPKTTEVSPLLKSGNKNKKTTGNFSE